MGLVARGLFDFSNFAWNLFCIPGECISSSAYELPFGGGTGFRFLGVSLLGFDLVEAFNRLDDC